MEFRILGPFEAEHDREPVMVGRRRERCLLGMLLLEANAAVPVERLIDLLWDEAVPSEPRAAIHTYVSRLRSCVDPAGDGGLGVRLARSGDGYLAEIEPDAVDALRMRVLIERAAGLKDPSRRAAALREALGLRRGPLLADVASDRLRERLGAPWDELWLMAREKAIDAELAHGRHRELIGELTGLCAEYPYRERFLGQLILALYRSGRQADALEAYVGADRRLRAEIGVGPGAELRELHRRVLWTDPDLLTVPASPSDSPAQAVPRQLPAAVRHFTGRDSEIKALSELLGEVGAAGGTVVISAIDGMAGIGKTALAVHAAHSLAEHFPDGQLFLDLHGYTEGMAPREPADALAALLESLDIAPQRMPADLETRAAVYRDRLAGTRTLIVLDNAAGESQVRPLLPGTGGCLVLVTSRRRLKALDDAHALPLDLLPAPDAVALFRAVAGSDRAMPDDPLLEEIAALCGRLPLALRITAAMLRHRPAWTLEHLVDRLRTAKPGLAPFSDGDRDLTAVFDLSYRALAGDRQLLLRRLALIPGPDADAYAAAALIGAGIAEAERLLQDLVDDNLLAEPELGRFRMHDLIRVYARELAERDPDEAREAALDRLLDYYLDTAQAADKCLTRRTPAYVPSVRHPPHQRPDPVTLAQASAWMHAELPNLTAAVDESAARADARHAVALPAVLHGYLRSHGPWPQAVRLHTIAASAAQRLGDPVGRITALTDLGTVRWLTDDYQEAAEVLGQALELARASGHRLGEANALTELGTVRWLTDDYQESVEILGRALELYQQCDDRRGRARAFAELGTVRRITGDYPGAIQAHELALELSWELGDRQGQAIALFGLGTVRQLTGEYPGAAEVLERSLELFRELDSRLGQRGALGALGHVRTSTGDYSGAASAFKQALELCRELGDRQSEAVALLGLGRVWQLTGDYPGASSVFKRSLELFRELESLQGEANALNDLGSVWRLTGDHAGATRAHQQALELYRHVGDPQGEAEALNRCAAVLAADGRPEQARVHYGEALRLAREIASPIDEANALDGIGESHLGEGNTADGIEHLRQALDIYRRLGVPDAARVETRLTQLSCPPS